jgi:hypothetical protein
MKRKLLPIYISITSAIQGFVEFCSTTTSIFLVSFIRRGSVSISNAGDFDGAGAQAQRILSVYCFARYLDIPFIFKPIEKIEFQPVDYIDSQEKLEREILNLNKWLEGSFIQGITPDGVKIWRAKRPHHLPWLLLRAIFMGRVRGQAIQLSLVDSYFATTSKPEVWNFLPQIEVKGEPKNVLEVHVHLRLTNFLGTGDRSISYRYFQNILESIELHIKQLGREYRVIIHTDFNGNIVNKELLLRYAYPNSLRYWKVLGILNNDFDVEMNALDGARNELQQLLTTKPHYEVFPASNWVDEWKSMGAADILIMGKSSFSAVGGLLNRDGLVVSPHYWDSGKPNWCVSDSEELIVDWLCEGLKRIR